MINPAIARLQSLGGLADLGGAAKPSVGGKEEDFGKMLVDALQEVNGAQTDAKGLQQDLLTGRRDVDIHDVMIAQEKASTAMQLTMAVRNKALEAFQEINRLPI